MCVENNVDNNLTSVYSNEKITLYTCFLVLAIYEWITYSCTECGGESLWLAIVICETKFTNATVHCILVSSKEMSVILGFNTLV